MPQRVVVLGRNVPRIAQQVVSLRAAAAGVVDIDVEFVDSDDPEIDLHQQCLGTAVVVVGMGNTRLFTSELAARLPDLELVQTMTAGTDYLDTSGLRALGLEVADNGGANAPAVAEHAITLIVMVHRRVLEQIDSVRSGTWAEGVTSNPSGFRTMVGSRVGIIGLGRIGSRVAKRLTGWECEIVYHDIASFDMSYERAAGATRIGLEQLLETSDVVTLHVPLDESTRHLISTAEFRTMKQDAVLINTSRGPVVDEAALIAALRNGSIGRPRPTCSRHRRATHMGRGDGLTALAISQQNASYERPG